jgi:hypothetical protein
MKYPDGAVRVSAPSVLAVRVVESHVSWDPSLLGLGQGEVAVGAGLLELVEHGHPEVLRSDPGGAVVFGQQRGRVSAVGPCALARLEQAGGLR